MRNAMPDAPVFLGLAGDVIGQARAGGSYQKVRWWGEMVNVLWERGDVAASMNLEDQFDQLAKKHDIAIFCSFLMDNFNGEVHAHMLPRLGTNHSHLIPVEDYARLERAVADALRETVGQDEARVLENRLLSEYGRPSTCRAPKRCYWHCVIFSRPLPIPSCSGAAGSSGCGLADDTQRVPVRLDRFPRGRDDAAASTASDLIGILEAVDVPIVVVRGLPIAGFNRAAAEVLGLSPSDNGRAARDISLLAGLPRGRTMRPVIASGVESRADFRDGDRWFVVRISPYSKKRSPGRRRPC